MFEIKLFNQEINLYKDNLCIIEGLKPKVSLMTGEVSDFSSVEIKENSVYYNIDDSHKLQIDFTHKDNTLACFVKFDTDYEVSYEMDALKENGLALTFKSIANDERFLGHFRYNPWWTRNFHTKDIKEFPEKTQTLFFKNQDDYYFLYPLADNSIVCDLEGSESGLDLKIKTNTVGSCEVEAHVFLLTFDTDVYKLGEKNAKAIGKFLNGAHKTVKERRYPEFLDYLGWCSWNAFYMDVNEEGVLSKALEFKNKNLPVKWLLLDHGWSQAKSIGQNEALTSFKENFYKFPNGLSGLKEKLQNEYGTKWLGVWQGFAGHWGAIDKDSEIATSMPENLLKTSAGNLIPYPDRKKSFDFWNTWHSYLADQGVDFVKVDIQSSLAVFTRGKIEPQKAALEAHLGLEASVGINFDNNIINCMGMATENVLNRPISAVSRNSNDFFPKKPNSFFVHAYDNAYNTLYHGDFYYGDWDMWWTNHEDAKNNAYLRALSGGPLYISDRVSETIADKLFPLILSDGFVLRCSEQGKVTRDQVLINPESIGKAIKVWNKYGNTYYLGVFAQSIEKDRLKAEISMQNICDGDEDYLFFKIGDNKGYKISHNNEIATELKRNDSELYSFTKYVDGIAFLGLINKYISSATIENEMNVKNGKMFILKESGTFAYSIEKAHEVFVNGAKVESIKNNDLFVVNLDETSDKMVVEIKFI